MNCRCRSVCHPVILKQFSHSATATTHSPCGRWIYICAFMFLITKMWFDNHLISKIFSASIPHLLPYHTEGKRVASEHRSVQPQQGIFLEAFSSLILEKNTSKQMHPLSGNSLWLQCPPPLILQVSRRQKMSGKSPEGKRLSWWQMNLLDLQDFKDSKSSRISKDMFD